jgi:hypothetical protein
MNHLSTLFKGSETRLRIFYPKKYIIATFRSFEISESAYHALRGVGFHGEEISAVSGVEMLKFFYDLRVRTGLLGVVMTGLSRLIGTEANFADRDIWEAQHGAGFLAVHCSSQNEADFIRQRLTPLGPVSMQWYCIGGVQSLV